jgi:hypothetical protein
MSHSSIPGPLRAALAAFTVAVGACDGGPGTGPARALPVALSVGVSTAAGDPAAAFDKVDRARVRLTDGATVVVDQSVPFSAQGGDVRLRVEVDGRFAGRTLALDLSLLRGADLLFTGQAPVPLAEQGPTTVALELRPVVSRVVLGALPTLSALGATAQLTATAEFATGDALPGAGIAWEGLDPGVATVSATGVVTAVANGQARVRATSGGVSAQGTLTVRQTVAEVVISPATLALTVGQNGALAVVLRDPRGHAVNDRTPQWSTSNAAVATVSAAGVVQAVGVGTATITAAADGATGTATVAVAPAAPGAPTNLTARADLTRVDLTWQDNATNETGYEVWRRASAGSESRIATLPANTTSFSDFATSVDEQYTYRVRACIATSCSAFSNTAAAATAPVPPGSLGVQFLSLTVRITWSNGARFATSILVEERRVEAPAFVAIATLDAGATTFDITHNDIYNAYRLRACNAAGCSDPSPSIVPIEYGEPGEAALLLWRLAPVPDRAIVRRPGSAATR